MKKIIYLIGILLIITFSTVEVLADPKGLPPSCSSIFVTDTHENGSMLVGG